MAVAYQEGMTLEAIERAVILHVFRVNRGNKTRTAAVLGIAIRTLDHKLEQYRKEVELEEAKPPKQFYRGMPVQPGFDIPTVRAHEARVEAELGERRKLELERSRTKAANQGDGSDVDYLRKNVAYPGHRQQESTLLSASEKAVSAESASEVPTELPVPMSVGKEVQEVSHAYDRTAGNARTGQSTRNKNR